MLASLLRKVSSKANSTLRNMKKSYIEKDFADNLQKLLQERNVHETIDFVRRSSSTIKQLNFKIKNTPLNILPTQSLRQRVFLTFLPSHRCIANDSSQKFKLVKRNSVIVEKIAKSEKFDKSKQPNSAHKNHSHQENSRQESFKDSPRRGEDYTKRGEQKSTEYESKSSDKDGFYLKKSEESAGTRAPCNRRGKCCARREKKSSRSDCDELKPRPSIVEEEMAEPDPPSPKARHWSENVGKRNQKSRRHKTSSSPMIYIPYQKSKPKKKLSKSKPTHEQTEETDCNVHRIRPLKSGKESRVSYSYAQEKPQVDLGDSRPNTETLKYRLSKCPSMVGSLKSKSTEEPKNVESLNVRSAGNEMKFEKRKKVKGYVSNGEWRKQKYKVQLKIYKKDNLDPCTPVITEIKKDSFVEPVLSPVHREVAKKVRNPCPPKYCPNVDVERTKIRKMKRKKVKRLRNRRYK